MKKILTLMFLFLMCIGIYAQKIEQSPVPEEYMFYNEMNFKGLSNNGVRPLPFIPNNSFKDTKAVLPTSFDLRDQGYVMPVRNQNPYGTCWAFSTCASLESTGMKKYDLTSLSISPLNMVNKNPYDWVDLDSGGNYCSSFAYLLRFLGPVAEKDNPYQSPWTSPLEKYDLLGVCEKSIIIEDGNYGLISDEILAIKQAVYENGALQLNYRHDDDCFNDATNAYYASSLLSYGGHAVTVVGWDDDFSKDNFLETPAGDGAFLIKNSWSTYWGDEGYFWMSYYDKGINNCCQFQFTQPGDVNYDKLYSYNDTSITTSYSIRYGKIKYLAEENGTIKGLQLTSINNDVTYDVDIYVNDVLKGSKSYTFEWAGYENVPLDSDIKISKNDEIVVLFDFNAENNSAIEYPFPTEGKIFGYTPTQYDEPYCSYYSTDGQSYYSFSSYGNIACGLLINTKIPVEKVNITDDKLSITENETYQLRANITPTNATNQNVSWKSSNESVATVSSSGLVKGIKPGTATITVTTEDGNKTDTCAVTVTKEIISVKSVSLDKTSLSVAEGLTSQLTATVLPANASDKSVTWTTSDPTVASVENGLVTGLTEGNAVITVITNDGNKEASCKVTVTGLIKVTSVKLNKTSLDLKLRSTSKLVATVLPTNASDKSVTWTSSNPSVVYVNNGIISGLKAGSSVITVKTNEGGKTATCKVNVIVPVTGVELSSNTLSINTGKSATLKATVSPSDASNKTVTWKTSNSKVATVSTSGVVKGVKAGTATITVTTKDGGYTDTCKVTVKDPVINVTSVKVSPTTLSLDTGKTYTLKATVYPTNATVKTVTWTTSNSKIATVSSKGLVKAIKAGTVTITATSNNGKKGTCKVTVKQPVTSVKVSPTSLSLEVGKTSKLTATVLPTNATVKTVTWKSSNTKIATVTSSGVVKGIKAGTVTITVSSNNGKTATCKVTVKTPVVKVTSVKVSPTTLSLKKGKTYTLKATVYPTNATVKTVTWKSSNTKIATVTSKGVVKGIKAGTATITVTTTDGKKTATCKVTVK